jgi:hypothetical protein
LAKGNPDPTVLNLNADVAKSMALNKTEDTQEDLISEDAEIGISKKSKKLSNPFGKYSWFVLILLFAIRLSNHQQ